MKWNCPKCGREFSKQKQEHFCIKPQNIDEYIARAGSGRPAKAA